MVLRRTSHTTHDMNRIRKMLPTTALTIIHVLFVFVFGVVVVVVVVGGMMVSVLVGRDALGLGIITALGSLTMLFTSALQF